MLHSKMSTGVCSSLRDKVAEDEWAARVELAAFYRIVSRYGMSQLTNNHITLRVPRSDGQFLLNPHGLSYDEITASSLMKINSDGEIALQPDHGLGINYTGYVIHGAIHDARPDTHCVAHTHSRSGTAVSSLECGLVLFNQSSQFLEGNVAYHDYEGPATNLEERERLVANLGTKDVLVLRNHGLLACGRTVAECFVNLFYAEMSCRAQIDAMSTGQKIIEVDPAAREAMRSSISAYRDSGHMGRMEWAAEMRWLDRTDISYRD